MQDQSFFELLRVSIGRSKCLSKTPEPKEWESLYKLAKKHCVLGVCFAGIKNLNREEQTIQRPLFLKWMATVAEIQKETERIAAECVSVYDRIKADGFDCCILKGIGLASNYGELSTLRQCGDIDILLNATVEESLAYAIKLEGKDFVWSYKHAHVNSLCSTEVDMHYRPVMSRNLHRNKKLQKWGDEIKRSGFVYRPTLGFATLKDPDNIIFVLYHIYWHFLFEGVGLRQIMDLYFLLKNAELTMSSEERGRVKNLIKSLGMTKFAGAVSWVLWYVFEGKDRDSVFCSNKSLFPKPNENQGLFFLSEIMTSGNMGHSDNRNKVSSNDSYFRRIVKKLKYYSRLWFYYPAEFLWTPIGSYYVRNWKKKMRKEVFTNL